MYLFSQQVDKATFLFWQSAKSDVADLEQKEQSKVWRIKPETNPKWINDKEWTHLLCHIICLHLPLSCFTFQQHCLQAESVQCDLHQNLFYSRVQDLFPDFPGLKNWTLQKLLWKPRRKIADGLKKPSSSLSKFSILSFSACFFN